MHQTIVDAMQALADAEVIFENEAEFQEKFGKKLEKMTESDGWRWRYGKNEEKFETAALDNKKAIEVDVVGRHNDKGMVAIELKYVKAKPHRGDKPSNAAGFPYDVAKDCLRLDLICGRHCKPVNELIPDNLQTYAIGMTDWPNFWQGTKPKRGWDAKFFYAIRSKAVRFEHDVIIHTLGRDSDNAIALGRCHIAFGRSWTGEWATYGSSKQTERFRYLLLRPASDAKPQWKHHQHPVDEQSAIFPFLNDDASKGWRSRKLLKKKKRRGNEQAAIDT